MNKNTFFSRLLVVIVWFIVANTAQAVTCQNNIPATNPDSVYTIDRAKGTVTDTRTGLMWKTCSEGQTWSGSTCSGDASGQTWSKALSGAATTTFAGYSDWRLPNANELMSVVEDCRTYSSINDTVFPNTPSSWFWSGSPVADDANYAWYVYFEYGSANYYSRSNALLVRLVRGGQSFDPFVLTVIKAGGGVGAVTSSDGSINCGATCAADFDHGSSVVLTAVPNTSSTFSGWSGSGCSGTGSCTVSMSAAHTVTATFTVKPITYSLSVSKVGSGSVSSDPSGINCGSDCVASFDKGKVVTLTATPASGYSFGGWSGACSNASGTCSVSMASAKAVTATFTAKPITYSLSVSKVGSGSVSSDPSGINCGSDCVASFDKGKVVTLTATPASGYSFGGWSGACSNTSGTCSVSMASAKTVTATFTAAPVTYQLTVSKTGSGLVSSDPSGINCGSDCVASFDKGKVVTLTATPASGYSFSGWSGACSNASGTCSVSMASAKAVTATFTAAPVTYQLTVSKTGSGSVSSDPPGINCGSSCSANFDSGSAVILTANPASGANFSGWSGCSPFATNPLQCQVDLTAAKTVTATFTTPVAPVTTYTLSVTKTGTGTVSSEPAGINCGSDCAENYASGKTVTLTAAPAADSTFVSWSGCTPIAANALQCTVKMNKAQTVTATFGVISPSTGGTLTVTTVGNGTVISDPVGINCGSLCAASFAGGSVILTALPAADETLLNWNGCTPVINNQNQCGVTPTTSTSVTATFSQKTTAAADVRVMAMVITPQYPRANKPFTAAITLRNLGNVPMNAGHMTVWVDQPTPQPLCDAVGGNLVATDELAAGASKTIVVPLTAADVGERVLRVIVDSRCKTSELNEGNNQAAKYYTTVKK